MPERKVEQVAKFKRDRRRLARRHPDLPDTVAAVLKRYSVEGPPGRYRQPGVGGQPVFKERLPLRGVGKRRGARLIVYCDDERVVALRLYTKSATSVLQNDVIQDALDAVDRLPPSARNLTE